jgi:RHS repeat-associated protein
MKNSHLWARRTRKQAGRPLVTSTPAGAHQISARIMKRMQTTPLLLAALFTIGFQPTARAHYHPGLQRWINRDPIHEPGFLSIQQYKFTWHLGLEVNVFAFVPNNPVSFIDPYGLNTDRNTASCAMKRIRNACNTGDTPNHSDCYDLCDYWSHLPNTDALEICMHQCETCTGMFRPRPTAAPRPAPTPGPTPKK